MQAIRGGRRAAWKQIHRGNETLRVEGLFDTYRESQRKRLTACVPGSLCSPPDLSPLHWVNTVLSGSFLFTVSSLPLWTRHPLTRGQLSLFLFLLPSPFTSVYAGHGYAPPIQFRFGTAQPMRGPRDRRTFSFAVSMGLERWTGGGTHPTPFSPSLRFWWYCDCFCNYSGVENRMWRARETFICISNYSNLSMKIF